VTNSIAAPLPLSLPAQYSLRTPELVYQRIPLVSNIATGKLIIKGYILNLSPYAFWSVWRGLRHIALKPTFDLLKCFQLWFLANETRAFDYTYLSTIEWNVRSCVTEVSQSRGDFSSQYGNNNQAARGPSNRKHPRQHPSRTAVTVPERVLSRDFQFIPSLVWWGRLLQQKKKWQRS